MLTTTRTILFLLALLVLIPGCGKSTKQKLTGMWAFDHSGMMEVGGEQAKVAQDMMSYGIVFQFNADGTLEIRGAETAKGTWKIVKESGDRATVEITHGDKKETLDIKIWPRGEEIQFQREGQEVPYLYCRPIDAP